MRPILVTCLLALAAASAAAQVISRPTDAPQVSAAGESWYQLREPILYEGEPYYPAGGAVFFNGNAMVRTGHYNGVPLYADATRDPYSVVYVPIGGGQLQPYERRRVGALAGTTGTTIPSFPIALRPESAPPFVPMAAGAPTNLPYSTGAVSAFTPEVMPPVVLLSSPAPAPVCTCETAAPVAVPATAVAPPLPVDRVAVLTARRPDNNDGVWIRYDGATWVSSGVAEPRTTAFMQVGEHAGFAVFRKQGDGDVIYLQSRDGVLAPYRRKG